MSIFYVSDRIQEDDCPDTAEIPFPSICRTRRQKRSPQFLFAKSVYYSVFGNRLRLAQISDVRAPVRGHNSILIAVLAALVLLAQHHSVLPHVSALVGTDNLD